MFQINIMSRKAVYEQLVDQMERYILMDIFKPDEKIPSVRSLSTELSVNPNTIQKAYTELDRRGVVYSVSGRGCFVSPQAKQKIGERKSGELDGLTEQIRELALAGVSREAVDHCVEEAYKAAASPKAKPEEDERPGHTAAGPQEEVEGRTSEAAGNTAVDDKDYAAWEGGSADDNS